MSETTWRDVAVSYPEFVQWVVQRFGPLPDGPVKQEDYERFRAAWEEEAAQANPGRSSEEG